MSQSEIYEFLVQNKNKSYSSKDLSLVFTIGKGSITTNLFKLYKYGMIDRKIKKVGTHNVFQYYCDTKKV